MRSIRRSVATIVSMAALSVTGLVMTSPASAAFTYFYVYTDGTVRYKAAHGEFSSGGILCVFDDEKDGHSGVAQYWRQQAPDIKYKLWNPKGDGTSECGYVPGPTGATWVFRAGYGEYSTKQVLKWGDVARVVW